jgi:hypothetical protein
MDKVQKYNSFNAENFALQTLQSLKVAVATASVTSTGPDLYEN